MANKDIEEKYLKVKKLLENKGRYNKPYILRHLHEKENLRKVFLSIIKNNPALINEVQKDSVVTKPTCYNYLFKLIDLHLIKRVFVQDILKGKIKNDEIKRKFDDFALKMPENLRRYYEAKTSFWEITEFGKELAEKSYEFEQEFKEKEI